MLARQHAGELHLGDAGIDIGEEPLDLGQGCFIPPLVAEIGEHVEVVKLAPGRFAAVDDFRQAGPLAQQILGLVAPIPETGLGDLGFEFGYPFLLARDVKDTSSAHRACS